MGNAESSPGELSRDRRNENEETDEEEDTQAPSAGTALKAGAAVAGTALLALGAWSLASSSRSAGETVRTTVGHESGRGRSSGGGSSYNDFHGPNIHHGRTAGYTGTPRMVKIMSYNIWSREDVEVHERMKSIGDLIWQHSPDIIFFQEVTPNIYEIFQSSGWWGTYKCSVPPEKAIKAYFCMLLSKLPVKFFVPIQFDNSTMGRDLSVAEVDVGAALPAKLFVATSHLKSPEPPAMYSMKRIAQAKQAVGMLNRVPNVVFGGDMNWDDGLDGPFPAMEGWVDAWPELKPGKPGWTFDTKSNPMLRGNRPLQKRLDRFLCKLSDFRLVDVDMIGQDAIPEIYYYNKGKRLPVLPSDHYGLLLTICIK